METGAISGNVSPSQIQTLIQYSAQILSGVIMVAMCLNFISLSKGSMDRICEVLNERTTLPKPQNPVFEIKDGSVIFENVSFAYSQKSDVSVLNNINLEIKSGETVGIIGATGLFLPAGNVYPALTQIVIESSRQSVNKFLCASLPRRRA